MIPGVYWVELAISSVGGGAISAVIGTIVGILVRRWLRQFKDLQTAQQEETKQTVKAAADRAVEASRIAATRSDAAGTQAYAASSSTQQLVENTEQVNKALVFLAENVGGLGDAVGHALDEVSLAGRLDRLLTTNVGLRNLLRAHGVPIPGEFAPPPTPAAPDDATTTGRHRLAGLTEAISTLTEPGDPE